METVTANSRQQELIDAVRSACSSQCVVTDPQEIAPWLTDQRDRYHGAAPAILYPGSTAEVATVVQLAARAGVPLVPQGGNTGMVGGATPPSDGSALILSLRRMNRIRSLDPASNLAVVEAGVVLQTLHEAACEKGRRFPLTLGARGSCTIGGLVSTNAGGTQVLRHGTMRSLVAGVEAVLADGSVHDGLAVLKKDNRGYDLNQLLIGAEGTLGIVTAASLRLVPDVIERAVAWVGLDHPRAALQLLRLCQAHTDSVEGFEIIGDESLQRVLEHIPGTRPPLSGSHRWHALIEAVKSSADAPDPAAVLEPILAEALETGLAEDVVLAASEAQAEAFWRIRHSISEAERASGPTVQHDISVPIDAMPDFMIDAAQTMESRFPGVSANSFGHLGDGNIHFHIRAGERAVPGWAEGEGKDISRQVHDLVTAASGSISAEHGIGQLKRDELLRLASPSRIAALRAIKHALDPGGLLNPGKLID